MKHATSTLLLLLSLSTLAASAQTGLTLRECLDYAESHNLTLLKDRLSLEAALQSRREVAGALLPQIGASSAISYNARKTTIAMPNFVNSMLPEAMRDPDAPKYMTVTMGMDYNASWGVTLTQQLLNFPLFNALDIATLAADLSGTGAEADREELIAKTATLYCSIQALSLALPLFDESIALMDRILSIVQVSGDSGLVRPVDIRQIAVNRTNLASEKESLEQAVGIQKNLLKLQMGFPMGEPIELQTPDIEALEEMLRSGTLNSFEVGRLLPYRVFSGRQRMLELQHRAAVYETLPTLSLSANYAMNYMGDSFRGETFRHFPVSVISLNLRFPLFTGLSRSASITKAKIELQSSSLDGQMLSESLTMAYSNALSSLGQNLRSMESQKRNREMAREVLAAVEVRYREGLASLSELLDADSALIRSQMNYVNALGGCMQAYIELKKADGTIRELSLIR